MKKQPIARNGATVVFLDPRLGERTCRLAKGPGKNVDGSMPYIPPDTPVGAALLGARAGDLRTVKAGDGTEYIITITAVTRPGEKLAAA